MPMVALFDTAANIARCVVDLSFAVSGYHGQVRYLYNQATVTKFAQKGFWGTTEGTTSGLVSLS